MSPLAVEGLCKNYPAFRLEDVSFRLTPGTITGFIGRNGAGKTTTINSILSFVRPDAGKISFFGMDYPEHDREIKEKIGFVSAGMTYYTRKKLKAITDVTRTFYPEWDDAAYRKWLDAFGLDEGKTPAELSNGMKIKYALALALSHGAELLILDEPTSGLDPVSREELVEVFLRLKDEGKTVFFSTHITSDLEKCADRILFLQQGRLKADEELETFREAWRIAECGKEIPEALKQASRGCCRIREGYTVLVRKEDAAAFETREASLEEIMIHLEKEAEEA
ncbi:MAG: ABC transporter ATP-binding protein [Clostridiales bacterium]|nr:ABC transporter ATP-binding protein [Clostridiales bacterium]